MGDKRTLADIAAPLSLLDADVASPDQVKHTWRKKIELLCGGVVSGMLARTEGRLNFRQILGQLRSDRVGRHDRIDSVEKLFSMVARGFSSQDPAGSSLSVIAKVMLLRNLRALDLPTLFPHEKESDGGVLLSELRALVEVNAIFLDKIYVGSQAAQAERDVPEIRKLDHFLQKYIADKL
ncbi:unnamed protein product [Amoebophrya sp. A25]|nr:unnamed protein product [Amoebophrya sp. A25]|eukprot:GSA25T00024664001.1